MAEDPRLESPTDEELVQRVREGEERAMNVLVDRHHSVVFRSCAAILEADTVIGTSSDKHCVLTFVDRKTGYVMIGKLEARTVEATNRRAVRLIKTAARPTHTITADNGTEFHGYGAIEAETGSKFYFAAPYHSWERGTSENTNGLIRQYLPKRTSMAHITQHACNRIAHKLNNRPRKRLGYRTPEECYVQI